MQLVIQLATKVTVSFLLLLAVILAGISRADAQSKPPYVPEQLKSWEEWITDNDAQFHCAFSVHGRQCSWPSKLKLSLDAQGGEFTYSGTLDLPSEVELPGGVLGMDNAAWPIDLKLAGRSTDFRVVAHAGVPSARLESGEFLLSGKFAWSEMPQSLRLPSNLGVLDLSINRRAILHPHFTESGELWLREKNIDQESKEANAATITVFRKLTDGVPFEIESVAQLRISGKSRPLILDDLIPPGSTVVQIDSQLAWELVEGKRISVQARSGQYTLSVKSFLAQPPSALAAEFSAEKRASTEEVWSWSADRELRSVEVSGAPGINPQRTSMPAEWRSLPAYVLTPGAKLDFKESRRGQEQLRPNAFGLARTLWLDFDGQGYSVQDSINAEINQGWRVNSLPPLRLERVTEHGVAQVITTDPSNQQAGIEVRNRALYLVAEGRIAERGSSLPAVGWDFDAKSLSVVLNLPPGWSLFAAAGPDQALGSWFSSWTLFDLFVLILIAAASARLLGLRVGALAFVGLVLAHADGAPIIIWILLLTLYALVKYLPEGKLRTSARVCYLVSLLALVLLLLPYLTAHIREAIFPGLDRFASSGDEFGQLGILFLGVIGLVVGLALAVAFGWFLGSLAGLGFWRSVKRLVSLCAAIAIVVFGLLFLGRMGISPARMHPAEMPVNAAVPAGVLQIQREAESSDDLGFSRHKAASGKLNAAPSSLESELRLSQELKKIDPNAVVQTGVGLPNWKWRSWQLTWNGPVDSRENLKLFLISPLGNACLNFIKVGIFLLLALAFVGKAELRNISAGRSFFGLGLALLFLSSVCVPRAFAQEYPSSELLDQLRSHLVAAVCQEDCVSSSGVLVKLSKNKESVNLQIEANVSSRGAAVWTVPGPLSTFAPSQVNVDGKESQRVRRSAAGFLEVGLSDGWHHVQISGEVRGADLFTLQFFEPTAAVSVQASGWLVDGLDRTGSVKSGIQFMRAVKHGAGSERSGASSDEAKLPSWFVVSRQLDISLPWLVTTTVERVDGSSEPVVIQVPIIKNEQVLSDNILVSDGLVNLAFGSGESRVSWSGRLPVASAFELSASRQARQSEHWSVACSEIWRCNFDALNPTSTISAGRNLVSFVPWPGDKLKVEVNRPSALPGNATTVYEAQVSYNPGQRILYGALDLAIRSTQGGWQKIILPQDATIESFRVANQEVYVQSGGADKRTVELPVEVGDKHYQLAWRMPWSESLLTKYPSIDLGSAVANLTVKVSPLRDRWLLWVSRAERGPVVLFWSKLLVALLLMAILWRSGIVPLTLAECLIFGCGLATLPAAFGVFPIFWFLLLVARGKFSFERRWVFNLFQLLILAVTLISLACMLEIIRNGLIVNLDMQVAGNGSSNYLLNWYQDRSPGLFSSPSIISVPVLAWHLVMLLWASWLVRSLLRWIKWGYTNFAKDGIWRSATRLSSSK